MAWTCSFDSIRFKFVPNTDPDCLEPTCTLVGLPYSPGGVWITQYLKHVSCVPLCGPVERTEINSHIEPPRAGNSRCPSIKSSSAIIANPLPVRPYSRGSIKSFHWIAGRARCVDHSNKEGIIGAQSWATSI